MHQPYSSLQARLGQTELTYMLSILSRVPELLGEGIMFGSGVVGRAVASCLQAAGGQSVTEEAWLAWASREPVELVWLTTAYRYRQPRHILILILILSLIWIRLTIPPLTSC
jgi:hypothetical protein